MSWESIDDELTFVWVMASYHQAPNYHHLTSPEVSELKMNYCKTSNISCTLGGNKIVDRSDVVGASPVDTAPTTSSFST